MTMSESRSVVLDARFEDVRQLRKDLAGMEAACEERDERIRRLVLRLEGVACERLARAEDLVRALRFLSSERDRWASQNHFLEQELSRYREDCRRLTEERAEVLGRLDSSRAEIDRLAREADYLRHDAVIKDAYLAEVRGAIAAEAKARSEIGHLRNELLRLDRAIHTTLAQPRYRIADWVNLGIKRFKLLHRLLKRLALSPVAKRVPGGPNTKA
jgi:chromosome segregation ATPase